MEAPSVSPSLGTSSVDAVKIMQGAGAVGDVEERLEREKKAQCFAMSHIFDLLNVHSHVKEELEIGIV